MNNHRNLHKPYIALPVLLLAAFFLAGPASQQPEYISNVQPDWDTRSGSFVIDFRATADLAERAVDEGYILMTTLTVTDRAGTLPTVTLTPGPFVVEELRDDTRGSGQVKLRPQFIAWNQEDGLYVGRFIIQVSAELKAPSGETIARTQPKSKTLCLPLGGTDVAKTC